MIGVDCEMLFWGGIVLMGAAVFLMIVCTMVFFITGRRLKAQLEEEYGKPFLGTGRGK